MAHARVLVPRALIIGYVPRAFVRHPCCFRWMLTAAVAVAPLCRANVVFLLCAPGVPTCWPCSCCLQVLVATSTLAWGVNTPAHLVIVKGTEFYDAPSRRYVDFPITDVLQVRQQGASSWALCLPRMHCLPPPAASVLNSKPSHRPNLVCLLLGCRR
jgi:hypothetical protein